jgi:hypothetical protein
MWLQIAGKIRMTLTPPVNHSWHVTLYVTPRGLGTSAIPHGSHAFEIVFDFCGHQLLVDAGQRGIARIPLRPQPVAAFYGQLMETLRGLDLPVAIHKRPNEVPDPIPFDEDETHRAYDAEYANRFWRALVQADRVLKQFRGRFVGKCSPVHFFWGAPDLAVTRFSGRRAPVHPGGVPNLPDSVTREAYSHEVSSCGFWWGGGAVPSAAFYAYAYPEPPGFAQAPLRPDGAYYSGDLKEFILPYDAVRLADDPDRTLLEFLQSTYEAAANLAGWDRPALER